MFHGKSMLPFLREGDELIVDPIGWENIRIGDIITCRLESKFPTYRVIKKLENKLLLKPDNWPNLYEAKKEDVLGKVVELKRESYFISYKHWRWHAYTFRVFFRYAIQKLRSRIRKKICT